MKAGSENAANSSVERGAVGGLGVWQDERCIDTHNKSVQWRNSEAGKTSLKERAKHRSRRNRNRSS